MERGYHYILILDITHLNLTAEEKNFIETEAAKIICQHNLGTIEAPKFHIKFLERMKIPEGMIDSEITTFILEDEKFNRMLEQVEKIQAKIVDEELTEYKRSAKFMEYQIENQLEIAKLVNSTGVMEKKFPLLQKPARVCFFGDYEDRRNIKNYQEGNSKKVLDAINKGEKIWEASLEEKMIKKTQPNWAIRLPDEKLPSGERIESISTFQPELSDLKKSPQTQQLSNKWKKGEKK